MRTLLLASAALIALSSGAAFATSDVDNVQVNVLSPQKATTTVGRVLVGGKLTIDNLAVGNTLSVENLGMSHLDNVQANVGSPQSATVSLNRFSVNGDIKIDNTAIGNTATVDGGSIGTLHSVQVNAASPQVATTTYSQGGTRYDKLTVSTVAVGNNLSATGVAAAGSPGSFVLQGNAFGGQTAVFGTGDAGAANIDVTTQAVGNVASLDATGNVTLAGIGQGNFLAPQTALTTTNGGSIPFKAKTDTLAVGNSLSVVSANGDIGLGGPLSGQANVLSPQTAVTSIGLNFVSFTKLDVSTVAVGNTASFDAKDDVNLGGAYVQANLGSPQTAVTSGGYQFSPGQTVLADDSVKITTAAIGNSLDITGYRVDASAVQVNAFSPQTATSSISKVSGAAAIGGSVTISTQAIGNAVSIRGR